MTKKKMSAAGRTGNVSGLETMHASSSGRRVGAIAAIALLACIFGIVPSWAQSERRVVLQGRPEVEVKFHNPLPVKEVNEPQRTVDPATSTLNFPYGLALDSAGNLYVANVYAGVNVYNQKTLKLQSTITSGLSYPIAVGVNFGGDIYVTNEYPGSINVYNSQLTQISTINDGTLVFPFSMYIDSANDIWVLDSNGTTHLFLDNGTPAGSSVSGGTAIGPWGPYVTVWGISDGNGGFNEDYMNVGEALHNGPAFSAYFAGSSPEAGGETEDSLGQQYVTDRVHNLVEIWGSSGSTEVAQFSTTQGGYGIAVDSLHHKIFVAEPTANVIEVFSSISPYKKLTTIH